jgi:hypothetical protein
MHKRLCLLLFLTWLPGLAPAQDGTELYAAEVPAADAAQRNRTVAVVDAFAAVLTKVTGRRDLRRDSRWKALAAAAPELVMQYTSREATAAAGATGTDGARNERLWVQFDRPGVDALLRDQGIPVWGEARPTTLLLVAVEDGANRFLLSGERMPEALAALQRARARRAVPVILPLLDLEDQATLRFTDVWANFREALLAAAVRYAPDGVLAGRLFRAAGGTWSAQWTLHLAAQQEAWETSGPLPEVLAQAVDELADRLARRYVPEELSSELVIPVTVDGIRSPADYARLMAYFTEIGAIDSFRLLAMTDERVELEARSRVTVEALARTIALGSLLRAAPELTGGAPASAGRLHFELLR